MRPNLHTTEPSRAETDLAEGPSAKAFTGQEKRKLFKAMVIRELDAGFLRYSRRQALLDYASKLHIPEFEACLLIAEAQFHAGDIDPVEFDSAATLEAVTRPETWSVPLRFAFALALAIGVDLLLIYLIFH